MKANNKTHSYEIRNFLECPHCSENVEVISDCYEAFCENCDNNFEYNIDKISK